MSLIAVRIRPIDPKDRETPSKQAYFAAELWDNEELIICRNGLEVFTVRNDGKVYRRVRKPELFPPGTSYSETWVSELVG